MRLGLDAASGMVIGYVVEDAVRWIAATEWTASVFDSHSYRALMENAWQDVAFVFRQ